jgi:hypothetical protein
LGSPSDRQALLLAEVSAAVHKTRPDVRFETIAYAACVAPPTNAVMDKHLLVDFCPINQCFEVQIDDPKSERNAAYVAQLKDWRKSFSGDISVYSYYRKYAWRSLPNILPHYMQSDLRFYRDAGVKGVSTYAEPGDWAAYELNHYTLGALAWNPDANLDHIIHEFAGARFGSESPLAMRAYQALEDNVRHLCSIPFTEMKSPAAYDNAIESFLALSTEIEAARGSINDQAISASLRRLGLTLEYVRRDLALQKAKAEKVDEKQRKKRMDELNQYIQEHAQDGVFLPNRMSPAKQAARYGLPKK